MQFSPSHSWRTVVFETKFRTLGHVQGDGEHLSRGLQTCSSRTVGRVFWRTAFIRRGSRNDWLIVEDNKRLENRQDRRHPIRSILPNPSTPTSSNSLSPNPMSMSFTPTSSNAPSPLLITHQTTTTRLSYTVNFNARMMLTVMLWRRLVTCTHKCRNVDLQPT